MQQISEICKNDQIDYLIIESSGISEPLPVAQAFLHDTLEGIPLHQIAQLDTLVTVLDVSSLFVDMHSSQTLLDRHWETSAMDTRPIAGLLMDQIEFATVVVLNKSDLLPEQSKEKLLQEARCLVKALNPSAEILVAEPFASVPISHLFNTKRFNFTQASQNPSWISELQKKHIPETAQYGIQSFSISSPLPFDAFRLHDLIGSDHSAFLDRFNIIRSKGACWMKQDDRIVVIWESAGYNHFSLVGKGFWHVAVDATSPKGNSDIWGDRKTEIVFIGIHLKIDELRSALQSCLLNQELERPSRTIHHPLVEIYNDIYHALGPERVKKLGKIRQRDLQIDINRIRERIIALASKATVLETQEIKEAIDLSKQYVQLLGPGEKSDEVIEALNALTALSTKNE